MSYKELEIISNKEEIAIQMLKSIKMGLYEPMEAKYRKIMKYYQRN
jgi:hypothetical protein